MKFCLMLLPFIPACLFLPAYSCHVLVNSFGLPPLFTLSSPGLATTKAVKEGTVWGGDEVGRLLAELRLGTTEFTSN